MGDIVSALLQVVHVCAAGIWFGGGIYLYMMAKADLAGDFALATRYNAMIARVSRIGVLMPIASITTTVAGVLVYGAVGYHNRGFGSLGSIVFHVGVLAGIVATVHGATSFGKAMQGVSKLTADSVAADGTVNASALAELTTAQEKITAALNIHVALVVLAFVCMVFGASYP